MRIEEMLIRLGSILGNFHLPVMLPHSFEKIGHALDSTGNIGGMGNDPGTPLKNLRIVAVEAVSELFVLLLSRGRKLSCLVFQKRIYPLEAVVNLFAKRSQIPALISLSKGFMDMVILLLAENVAGAVPGICRNIEWLKALRSFAHVTV